MCKRQINCDLRSRSTHETLHPELDVTVCVTDDCITRFCCHLLQHSAAGHALNVLQGCNILWVCCIALCYVDSCVYAKTHAGTYAYNHIC